MAFVNPYTTLTELNLKIAPDKSAKNIAVLKEGETVNMEEAYNDLALKKIWYKVGTKNGKEGWCFSEELQKMDQNQKKTMQLDDFLRQNGLEQYNKIFAENKIENIDIAMELTDNDLMNMGISVLGDRKKLLKIFSPESKGIKIVESARAEKTAKMPLHKGGGSFAKIAIAVLSVLVVVLGVIVLTGLNSNNSNTASDSQSSTPTMGDSSNTIITQAEARSRFRMGYNDAYENYDAKQDLYGRSPLDLILNGSSRNRNMSSSKFYNAGYDAGVLDGRQRNSYDSSGAWNRSKWALYGFTPLDLID